MAKGKRRAFNDPAKQLQAVTRADKAKNPTPKKIKPRKGAYKFGNGITFSSDKWVWGGDAVTITYNEDTGGWYGEAMKELQPKESEKPKVETTKDWAEKWADEHKS